MRSSAHPMSVGWDSRGRRSAWYCCLRPTRRARSSTSNSEPPMPQRHGLDARRAIWLFFVLVAVMLGAAEVGTRKVVLPISRIEQRTSAELHAAVQPPPDGQHA